MRLLHAFGLSLASSGAALSLTGLCATADAQPTHRAARAATIAEFAAPRREGYDNVIVQLPPLSPVRGGAQKPAEPVVTAAPEAAAAAAADAPTMVTTAARASAPAAASPETIHEETPAGVEAAASKEAAQSEPPAAMVDHDEASAGSAERPLFATAPTSEPVLSAPEALPAEGALVAEPPPAAEPPSAVAVPAPAEETPVAERDAPPPESAPVPAPEETVPVVAQADPPPTSAADAGDDQDSGSWSWSLLTFTVAIVSLAGFAASRRRRTRRAAPPPAAAAPVAPEKKRARLATLITAAREKIAPRLLALLQKLRNRKGHAMEASGEAEPVPDWAWIASTLRAAARSGVDPAPSPEAKRDDSSVVEAPKAESNRWEEDREEGLELLEPGSNSARTLVMNARRKLQAVGER
jgi:hypothetical protein